MKQVFGFFENEPDLSRALGNLLNLGIPESSIVSLRYVPERNQSFSTSSALGNIVVESFSKMEDLLTRLHDLQLNKESILQLMEPLSKHQIAFGIFHVQNENSFYEVSRILSECGGSPVLSTELTGSARKTPNPRFESGALSS